MNEVYHSPSLGMRKTQRAQTVRPALEDFRRLFITDRLLLRYTVLFRYYRPNLNNRSALPFLEAGNLRRIDLSLQSLLDLLLHRTAYEYRHRAYSCLYPPLTPV